MAKKHEYKVAGIMGDTRLGIMGDAAEVLRVFSEEGWRLSSPLIGGEGNTIGLILERQVQVEVDDGNILSDALHENQQMADTIEKLRKAIMTLHDNIGQISNRMLGYMEIKRIAAEAQAVALGALASKGARVSGGAPDDHAQYTPAGDATARHGSAGRDGEQAKLERAALLRQSARLHAVTRICGEYERSGFQDPGRAMDDVRDALGRR